MEGVLIVDKPAGLTSHDVVAWVRRALREKRVGHTGTLDPFATGVLVVLVGRATRLAQFMSGAEKEYLATIRLGYATDTGDLTGRRREVADEGGAASTFDCASIDRARVEAALAPLRGEIGQVPPMYSAKKVKGEKLYELARRGETIEREAVRVRVSAFEVMAEEGGEWLRRNEDGTCDLRVRVVCSAGTYVRALAESFGENLGVGAHLSALRRTRAGSFRIEAALGLEELQARAEAGEAGGALISLETALPEMPAAHLTAGDAARARHGAALPAGVRGVESLADGARVRLLDERGRLVAVAVYDAAAGLLRPRVTLADAK